MRAPALRDIRFGCVYSNDHISRRIGFAFGPGVLPPSSCKRRFPYRWRFLTRLRQTSRGANTARAAWPRLRRRPPPERRTAASGPARLPRGRPPRRPSSVDSLYIGGFSFVSILKKLRCDRLFKCSSISTASGPTHVCRSASGLVPKTKKRRELPTQPSS